MSSTLCGVHSSCGHFRSSFCSTRWLALGVWIEAMWGVRCAGRLHPVSRYFSLRERRPHAPRSGRCPRVEESLPLKVLWTPVEKRTMRLAAAKIPQLGGFVCPESHPLDSKVFNPKDPSTLDPKPLKS